MPERKGEIEPTPDLITIGGVGYQPGTVGYSLAAEIMRLDATVKRVESALAYTSERGVSCGGLSIDAEGCFAGDLAARVRAALIPPAGEVRDA